MKANTTESFIVRACHAFRYDEDAIFELIRFNSSSFLEQRASEVSLKSREPSFNTFSKKLNLVTNSVTVSSSKLQEHLGSTRREGSSSLIEQYISCLPELRPAPEDTLLNTTKGKEIKQHDDGPSTVDDTRRTAHATSIVVSNNHPDWYIHST